MRLKRALTLGFALSLAPLTTFGAPCGRPDLEGTFPADGAMAVPLDATLAAVYAETAEYLGESVNMTSGGEPTALDVTFDTSERRLAAPSAGLAANTTYTVEWPGLRGLTSAGRGLGRTVTFTTGAQTDLAAPTFAGISRLHGDLAHPRDDCTDELEPRMTFDFTLGAADDDGGRETLALMLFQTRGSLLPDGAPKLVALQPFPANDKARVELPVEGATGRVCFAAVARDLVGRTSPTGSSEHCVDLAEPPFFYGCGLVPSRASGTSPVLDLAILLGLFGLHRRRRRRG